jgi:Lanthionine synthetase C-like protein
MTPTTERATRAEELGRQGLEWLLGRARAGDADSGSLAWPYVPSAEETNPTLRYGSAGIVLTLLEGGRHFGEHRYADAALRGARSIAAAVPSWDTDSLHVGLAGLAFPLRAVARLSGDEASGGAADRALERIRTRFDSGTGRWNEMFELLAGNAGIGLGALAAGDVELALLAVTPYLRTADPTPGGVNWRVRPSEARSHHVAHGTLGIVYALAAVGQAADRRDLIELALLGAADVVARDEQGPEGFLVPHSDPPHRPDIIERYSYGWCNGPAGDAQVFRLLAGVTGDAAWTALGERCWNTVTRSGLPKRLRPGFWDNNGSCCGTAGVLALACDRLAEGSDKGPDCGTSADDGTSADGTTSRFADLLVDDLIERATVDGSGARWSNYEHTATPGELEPQTGWANGNAGIVRELLRYARIRHGGDPAYAVALPDQPPCRSEV